MTTQIDNVFNSASGKLGKLRLAPNGLGWKSIEEDGAEVVTLAASDMKWMQWARVARDFQLLIGRKSSEDRLTFEGFQRDDHERIAAFTKMHYSMTLEKTETSLKGHNWGKIDVQGPNLAFLVDKKPAFTLPLAKIANSNMAGKTEVSLEIAPPPAAPPQATGGGKVRVKAVDELVEMRFHVPGTAAKDDDDPGSDADGEETVSAAQAFHDMIKERADIDVGAAGEGVVVFNEVLVLTPRGRYDVDMFLTNFRLRGKTYDYKILYSSVTRLFLLPKADEIHTQLVIGLDPPIRQGQTRYPYLVMQFTKDEEMDAELNLDEDQLAEKSLQKKYEAPASDVVSQVFKALTNRKIVRPADFVSTSGQHVVKCNLKAIQGELYFLDKSVIFIAKQPVLVDFSNIASLSFSRVGGNMASSKTFDLSISLKSRSDGGTDYSFTGLAKDDAEPIKSFLSARKVKVTDTTEEEEATLAELDDGSDDDDMDSPSEDDSEDDGKKNKKSKSAKPSAPSGGGGGGGGGDDDDDESDDEDFQSESESDGGSASSSSDDDSDVDMDEPAPKKKSAAKKSSGGSDDGEPKKKKPKNDSD